VASGNHDPQCSITICGDDTCGPSFTLTTSYNQYSFVYQSPTDESGAVATFQFECLQSGYVALDDVSVTSDSSSSSPGQSVSTKTTTVYRTEVVVQSQTYIQIETTTFVNGSEVVLTYVTLSPSTVVVTLQQPVVTITPDPITQVSTLDAQTSMVISDFEVTSTVYTTLPQETTYFTTDPLTEQVTITLPRGTITSTISVTPLPLTETVTISATLSAETQTAIQSLTLPAVTQTIEVDDYLPHITETLTATQTLIDIVAGPTITQTYSPPFILKIVGGFYDGIYVDATPWPYENTTNVFTVGSVDPEAATIFSIDPDDGALSTASGPYGLTARTSGSSLIVSSSPYTLQMTCADVEGYLSCAGDVFTIFSVQDFGYLETPAFQSIYAQPFVGVQYQIIYLATPAAATTSSVAASTTTTSSSAATSPASVCDTEYTDTSVTPEEYYGISCTVNYGGSSVATLVTSTLIECMQHCSSSEPCVAVVWVEQGQGSPHCYLKDANAASQLADIPSGLVLYSATQNYGAVPSTTTSSCGTSYEDTHITPAIGYSISCTVNYGGSSVATLVTSTLIECIQHCSSTEPCVAVVWVEPAYCFLKDATAASQLAVTPSGLVLYSATQISAANVCDTAYEDTSVSPPDGYSISCTIDYPAGNIDRIVTSSLIVCIEYCSRIPQCEAAVWVERGQDQQWCYTKDADTVAQPAPFPDTVVAYSATMDPQLQ
jgi:hypothetical protein